MAHALKVGFGHHCAAVLVQLQGAVAVDAVGVGVLLVSGSSRGIVLGLGLLDPLGFVVDIPIIGQGEGGWLICCSQALGPLNGAIGVLVLDHVLAGVVAATVLLEGDIGLGRADVDIGKCCAF